MSRVSTRPQSSVRALNLKAEARQKMTLGFALLGVLLSMISIWGNDLNRVTNIDMSCAGAAAVCFLIVGYRTGFFRR